MKKQNNMKCLIKNIKNKKSYSFCTQCMDVPLLDEEGYCELCNVLVDEDDVIDTALENKSYVYTGN